MTEVWFRNPDNYIKELVEQGQGNIAWSRGLLVKKKIDPVKHAMLYFGPAGIKFRVLLVGEQGTCELRTGNTLEKPAAVYPTWQYGTDDLSLLEELLERPVGQDMMACNDKSVAPDERPVWGQEHRVVIIDIPPLNTAPGRKMMALLKTFQEDYPEAIIHVHGLYGYRPAFGMGLGSADVEVRTSAQKGKLLLPSGKEERYERVTVNAQWITMLGFKPADMSVPRNRCMYNIQSALWAGKYFDQIFNFKGRKVEPDTTTPAASYTPPTDNRTIMKNKLPVLAGDKFECNTCSLSDHCKHFRDGAVCSLPDSESRELSSFFRTRDSGQILDGLSMLVQKSAERAERAIKVEEVLGDINPDTTKLISQVFDQGQKLAKLVDPSLRAGPRVSVNVGANGAQITSGTNPRQLIASAIRELEGQGIRREDITPEMIQGLLEGMANPESAQRAITGTVVAHEDGKAS